MLFKNWKHVFKMFYQKSLESLKKVRGNGVGVFGRIVCKIFIIFWNMYKWKNILKYV